MADINISLAKWQKILVLRDRHLACDCQVWLVECCFRCGVIVPIGGLLPSTADPSSMLQSERPNV
jgi:hypothetical protein